MIVLAVPGIWGALASLVGGRHMDDRKIIVLTGASRGIGHATVKRFSQEGWRVITCSRNGFPENCPGEAMRNWHRVTGKVEQLKHNKKYHQMMIRCAMKKKKSNSGILNYKHYEEDI